MALRQLSSLLCVLVALFCVVIWAGGQTEQLDVFKLGQYAQDFPTGKKTGPLIGTLLMLLTAFLVYPRTAYIRFEGAHPNWQRGSNLGMAEMTTRPARGALPHHERLPVHADTTLDSDTYRRCSVCGALAMEEVTRPGGHGHRPASPPGSRRHRGMGLHP